MLIGQDNLKSRIGDLLADGNLPNTIIFVGPRGQGKREVVRWLAAQMNAPVYVPQDLKIDSIRALNLDSRTISSRKIYMLADCETMTPQAQNALLKLAEEPPENAYIAMTVQDVGTLLPTILSRSIVFRLDGYTLGELKQFTHDEQLIAIAGNPGNIHRLGTSGYLNLIVHARKVVANISKISVANAFNILKSIDKEEFDLFISMLIYAYSEVIARGEKCGEQLSVIHNTKNLIERSTSVNKQNALEMMFVELREVAIDEIQQSESRA